MNYVPEPTPEANHKKNRDEKPERAISLDKQQMGYKNFGNILHKNSNSNYLSEESTNSEPVGTHEKLPFFVSKKRYCKAFIRV
jgi:hypothetical protein